MRSCCAIKAVSRASPVCSRTRNCGVKRCDSARQLNMRDLGATTREGPRPKVRRDSRTASTCAVLPRSEGHTSELQSPCNLVCRLLLEKKRNQSPATNRCSAGPGQERSSLPDVLSSRRPLACPGAGSVLFFFNDTAPTEIYTLSLHDALPI